MITTGETMEIPRDLLVPILQLKVKAVFKLFSGRHENCGERLVTVGRKTYAVADITSTRVKKIDEITQEDLEMGNFKSLDDFKTWWFLQGYREYNPIYVIKFNILKLKPLGKWKLKKLNLRIPIIREELGDYDE
jgi:hypothetical protein